MIIFYRSELMKNEQELAIQKISPYIRYVNNIHFRSGDIVQERIIYDHEFIFGLSGEARMRYGDEEYKIGASDLFYLKPNIKNKMYIEQGKAFHAHCIHFDWAFVDEQFNFTVEQYYLKRNLTPEERNYTEKLKQRPSYEVSDFCLPSLISGLDYDIIAPLFKGIYHCFCQSDVSARLKERSIFIQIIAEILSQLLTEHGVQKGPYHQKTISQAIHYMKSNYKSAVTTPVLASQFGLSSKYFGILFKSMTGMTVQEYLLDIRIQIAKGLLIHTQKPLEEIAEEIGIGDVFYFTKLFKRHEGITPGKYRRMLANVS
jgi:AraC-like DNA-binding protein